MQEHVILKKLCARSAIFGDLNGQKRELKKTTFPRFAIFGDSLYSLCGDSVQAAIKKNEWRERKTLTETMVYLKELITQMFTGAPQTVVTGFEKYFGSRVFWGEFQCPPYLMVLILLLSGICFMGISVIIISKKK